MPGEYRKLIVEGVMQYAHWAQDTKKHTFEHAVPPKLKKEWISIEPKFTLDKKEFKVQVALKHSIPHSLPSGLFGFKAVDLIVALKSPSGKTIEEKLVTFYVEEEKNLIFGKTYKKLFTFTKASRREAEYVEFRVVRRKSRVDFGRVIYSQRNRI